MNDFYYLSRTSVLVKTEKELKILQKSDKSAVTITARDLFELNVVGIL